MPSFFRRLAGHFLRLRTAWLFLAGAWQVAAQAQFAYTTNNGTLTIVQYTGPGGDVVIPDTINGLKVSTVGSQAFFQANSMTSLTFGANVTTIEQNAVFQCPALATVIIPQSVTNIGDGPFVDCKGLTTISLTGSNPFYVVTNGVLFNRSLRYLVEFPGGVGGSDTISDIVTNTGEAFVGNSLTSIVVNPANPIYASTNGVLFNKNFTWLLSYPGAAPGSYAVPNTVSTILSASFEFSTGVTDVTLGTNVTSIGYAAFYDCSAMTSITVNSNNAFYSTTNGVLYDKAMTVLIQYPSGLPGTYVGLTSVSIPDAVTNIGFETFYSCINLSNVALGEGNICLNPFGTGWSGNLRHAMARHIVEVSLPTPGRPAAQERHAREVIHRVLGLGSNVVRVNNVSGESQGTCTVDVRLDLHHTFTFWIWGEYLVNIPPKSRI